MELLSGEADESNNNKKKQRTANHQSRSESELDQEATAALLMLNHDRRRHGHEWPGVGAVGPPQDVVGGAGRAASSSAGMSVRDLLSG